MDNKELTVAPSIFTREFNAPRQLVFDAWTQVDHLINWMFPQVGFVCEYVTTEIKTGGSTLHKMTAPNGHEMWLFTKYEKVTSPDTIIFRQYNSNADGDILPGHMPDWPNEMLATVLLEEINGKTKLELIWQPMEVTQAEIDAFEASRSQHVNGWGSGFDQLATYLEKIN